MACRDNSTSIGYRGKSVITRRLFWITFLSWFIFVKKKKKKYVSGYRIVLFDEYLWFENGSMQEEEKCEIKK